MTPDAPGSTAPARAECLGLRRASPFLGVMAVVRTDAGRALSADGQRWQIQVLAHPPRGLWSNDGYQEALRYFRFGVWTPGEGLGRVPLNPILDAGRMIAAAEGLTAAIRASLERLPFPLADPLELWQLDRDHRPLALIATAPEDMDLDAQTPSPWSAGSGPERPFTSGTLPPPTHPGEHAARLERLVREASGRVLNRQWFRRHGDGTGEGLDHRAPLPGLVGRRLPPAAFPTLTLRTAWDTPADRALVADYIAWLSPYLLTLPSLDDADRARLERAALAHPLLVDALWRLLPRVLDREGIDRARVEARLRRAAT